MNKSIVAKKLKRILVSMIVAAFIFMLLPATAYAASKAPVFRSADRTVYFWVTESNSKSNLALYIDNIKKGDKLISVKSSNTKVATAKNKLFTVKATKEKYIGVTRKSVGATKITAKIKRNNKTYTTSQNVKYLKYSNPVKSFKIGNNDYARFLNKNFVSNINESGKKKVTVKAQNGWKVLWLHTYNNKTGKAVYGIKNGSTISMKKNMNIGVRLEKRIGNENVTVSVTLYN